MMNVDKSKFQFGIVGDRFMVRDLDKIFLNDFSIESVGILLLPNRDYFYVMMEYGYGQDGQDQNQENLKEGKKEVEDFENEKKFCGFVVDVCFCFPLFLTPQPLLCFLNSVTQISCGIS